MSDHLYFESTASRRLREMRERQDKAITTRRIIADFGIGCATAVFLGCILWAAAIKCAGTDAQIARINQESISHVEQR